MRPGSRVQERKSKWKRCSAEAVSAAQTGLAVFSRAAEALGIPVCFQGEEPAGTVTRVCSRLKESISRDAAFYVLNFGKVYAMIIVSVPAENIVFGHFCKTTKKQKERKTNE